MAENQELKLALDVTVKESRKAVLALEAQLAVAERGTAQQPEQPTLTQQEHQHIDETNWRVSGELELRLGLMEQELIWHRARSGLRAKEDKTWDPAWDDNVGYRQGDAETGVPALDQIIAMAGDAHPGQVLQQATPVSSWAGEVPRALGPESGSVSSSKMGNSYSKGSKGRYSFVEAGPMSDAEKDELQRLILPAMAKRASRTFNH